VGEERKDIKEILIDAMGKATADERAAYLDAVCGSDSALRGEIESLLKMEEQVGDFLEAPVLRPDIILDESPLVEVPGAVIGRYKLLERIGEGGMAAVYMAEQAEPIRRKVALKIIKLGMDTKSVIARFEAERQALAMMDHPNIAKVFDAGATETGRPYFVMELVTGVSITEYCDKNNVNTKERLALFIQVCHAVQHAHQKGVIHRDIKPSNVLVTRHDGRPVPKVIDFGIARATNQRLTEKTLFTRYAHIIGTPAYMSPEQAELSDVDIDTRSDVYSLGVLLYELLTGTTPFSEEELRKAGYLEMQRLIREEEPAKPSTRLNTLGQTLTDIAKCRASTPDLLTRAIRGDLDWIVMKTLEKVRDRRYDNASALALDVQRHLKDEPVLARPPGTVYRLRKLLRRHRLQAGVALAASVLLGALLVVILMWSHNRRRMNMEESVRHRIALGRANYTFNRDDLTAALAEVESILDSKHVGLEACLLHERILSRAQGKVAHHTNQIETDPENPDNYFSRAQYYYLMSDRAKAHADMLQYSAIASQGRPSDAQFGAITNLGAVVNSSSHELSVCTSADGLSLAFWRGASFDDPGGWWVTTRQTDDSAWDVPVDFGPDADSYLDLIPMDNVLSFMTADGLELYLGNMDVQEPSEHGGLDLYMWNRETEDDDWGASTNLGQVINSSRDEKFPSISRDGLELYFCSNRPGGVGNYDIWVAKRTARNAAWTAPVSLGRTINSRADDQGACLSSDGLVLFFDSTRGDGYGGMDLYMTRRSSRSDPWGAAVNLGPIVNSPAHERVAHISADGSTLYFDSDRPGGFGGHDIWQVSIVSLGSD
jgi:serine/threonine protein kinase